MLDFVQQLESDGAELTEGWVRSGHRRLRPVLMTPWPPGWACCRWRGASVRGAEMLRPLAIAIIGALCISVLLSLVATPVVYFYFAADYDPLKSSMTGGRVKPRV